MSQKIMPMLARLLIIVLALADTILVATPNAASANGCDKATALQNYGPDRGVIYAHKLSGNMYSASLSFVLTTQQVNNLRCLGAYLEIDFRLHGSGLQGNWEGYSTFSNMIGAIHDTSASDASPQPAVTGIRTGHINPNQAYYAGIYWTQSGLPADTRVSVHWTPQYLAGFRGEIYSESASEAYLCATADVLNWPYEFAYCTFGVKRLDGQDAGFFLSDHFFSDRYFLGELPFTPAIACYDFGGWGCAGERINENGTPPANAIVDRPVTAQSLYRGPVPDGTIVQNVSGSSLYSAAGGRLFWFDKHNAPLREALLTQRRARYGEVPFLVMADADIHAVEVNRTSIGAYSPGTHMPADNTFLYEYGNATQYVIKFQHPFPIGSETEVTALGGANQAVMVPPAIADLSHYPAQWVQNDLLHFYGDPTIWHYAGDRGFRVPSVPTRDCLSVRHSRGVTLLPASAWNSFPTHPTQQAACDFANDQWLFGTPSNRQMVMLYGAGYNVASAEEVIALGGQNKAVPVADETVTGLLARTGSLPNDELVKSYNDPKVYHIVDNKLHYVGSPATRDCLSARSGKTVRTVPIDLIGRMQANGQTGANAYCELENRQLLAPNGATVGYVKDGYRRPVTNPAIRDCIAVRASAGQPLRVSDQVWNGYTAGPNAYCPYETEAGLNFVREAGSQIVWLVGPGAGAPGTKRHAGSLCVPDPDTTQLKEYHVWTVPAGETAGHVQGADWWADGLKCQALPKG